MHSPYCPFFVGHILTQKNLCSVCDVYLATLKLCAYYFYYLVVVQSPSCVRLCSPWTAACQAPLSLTISQNSLKFMFIATVMPSSHLMLWCRLLFLPSIFCSFRDFSSESAVHIRWQVFWSPGHFFYLSFFKNILVYYKKYILKNILYSCVS